MGKKEIIEAIFNRCRKSGDLVFDNNLVRDIGFKAGFKGNPYDITKIDNISKLPDKLLKEDYFIAHLGGGRHKFIKGIDKIYHKFEAMENGEIVEWPYRPSLLNDFSISESSILSLTNNHRILHDFLYQDFSASPKMYNSERKNKISFDYYIGEEPCSFNNLQIEIDLTLEFNGFVTIFEGKNAPRGKWIETFNVYQLYNSFRYYQNLKDAHKLDIKRLTACYLVRQKNDENSIIRLYNYIFEKPVDITSIKVLKKREYQLNKRNYENE